MANVKVAIRLFVYKDIKYMGTIAKGEITLSTVNDAYTVSLSNPVCAIHADFDGSHPQLDNATTLVTVKRGDKPVKFEITDGSVSVNGVEHLQSTRIDDYQWRLTWRSVNTNALEGYGTIQLMTLDGFAYSTTIEWKYSILRESTMLDWIQDWEGGKTKIGSAYIMTPKMFIGKKDDYGQYVGQVDDIAAIPGLTGVYIGPDNLSAGIYGYKDSVEIFHLNEEGGKIGGWDINSDTISCGNLWLDSHGSILARNDEGDKIWWLKENGYAEFAFGNVKFYANGNAEYTGEITATGGTIGGWSIHNNQLESPAGCTFIDGIAGALGICAGVRVQEAVTGRTLIEQSVRGTGGVAMFYNSANSFGLIGYVPSGASAKQVFAVGSTNYIAGWNFTTDSLYLGANKNNTKRKYTSASGEITLGTNGIRGNAWYLDNDGVASFAGDKIHFEADGGSIVGWKVNNNRLSTNNVAFVSVDGYYGLYLTQASNAGFNSWAASALSTHIEGNGGIYIQTNNSRAVLAAYNTSGQKLFGLFSNGTSTIAGWKFNNDSLFTGDAAVTNAASYAASGCISLGPTGIFGSKWKLLGDGSGSLASGKIAWAADGTITFDAPVSANNITAGTISTADIKAANGSWWLKQDGSGSLANGGITWQKSGNAEFSGKVTANSGSIGGFEISSGHIGVSSNASSEGSGDWANLSLYKDFIKVGGSKGYVMMGNDVIPSSVGGAFTAVGRIVNNAPNTYGSYGFDQANYGLFINVTGGTKNYGIHSDAALMAPAFVCTSAKRLTFSGGTYSVDFSQNNVILLYWNDANYDATNVTLPDELSVARQFGYSSLPSDFATIVIFRVRAGSKKIILKNIYNSNEDLQDYSMLGGDSVILLISKADGFRYQILNYFV